MVAPPYSPKAIAAIEDKVRALTRELLAPLIAHRRFDVYEDLANPLATMVIADLIGLPRDEAMSLRKLVTEFFVREPGQIGTTPKNEAARIALMTRLAEIVTERKEAGDDGGNDHLSVLLRTPAEGAPLTIGAILAAIYTLLVTGAEVVPLSVANTIYYLDTHPDQRNRLIAHPEEIPFAYDESLRFDQPTNLLGRFVKEPVEIGAKKLEPGQGVMFLWASGNRDEREFERADEFDISRRPRRNLSFGHGAHKCIGKDLGLLEGRVLLEEILAAAPGYAVDAAGARRTYSEFLHGYDRMPIEF